MQLAKFTYARHYQFVDYSFTLCKQILSSFCFHCLYVYMILRRGIGVSIFSLSAQSSNNELNRTVYLLCRNVQQDLAFRRRQVSWIIYFIELNICISRLQGVRKSYDY